MDELRYPIGRFQPRAELTDDQRDSLVDTIAATPGALRAAVDGLSDRQLDTPYRPGGWTVRQVVHHVPDSHLNGYVRFKLAVTEFEPTIKLYDQDGWAGLADATSAPIEVSLSLLDALHRRWVRFLGGLEPEHYRRTIRHPEMGVVTLDTNLQLYAWHGRHHVAHINGLRTREGW